ncbi:hypothetical protein ACYOEI_08735 [Singulisphaera rosea]
MTNRIFRTLGGDGASLELPGSWRDLTALWSQLYRDPSGGYRVLSVCVASRLAWRRRDLRECVRFRLAHPWVMKAGPVVVVVSIKPVGLSDSDWSDLITEDMTRRGAR